MSELLLLNSSFPAACDGAAASPLQIFSADRAAFLLEMKVYYIVGKISLGELFSWSPKLMETKEKTEQAESL
jgi:hypothetical protein